MALEISAPESNGIDPKAPHPDFPGLTYADVAKAHKSARDKADAARKAAAMTRAEEAEAKRLEREEGVTTGGIEAEMVEITLDLPVHMDRVVIDGAQYFNRKTYRVPRGKAATMLEIQYRGQEAEAARLGQDKMSFYAGMTKRNTSIRNVGGNMAVENAPAGTH